MVHVTLISCALVQEWNQYFFVLTSTKLHFTKQSNESPSGAGGDEDGDEEDEDDYMDEWTMNYNKTVGTSNVRNLHGQQRYRLILLQK